MSFLRHLPCPNCGSSDAGAEYTNGGVFCFACNTLIKKEKDISNVSKRNIRLDFRPIPKEFHALRGISQKTCEKYQIFGDDERHYYPYFDENGNHCANKVRDVLKKTFYWEGDKQAARLFGQQLFQKGSTRSITLLEGELDAPSAFELSGSRYPCVSVHSASAAPRNCADNFEYLNSFEQIVLCFDKDEAHVRPDGTIFYPGQEAALVCAGMFPIGKVRILTLSEKKDANDYLVAGLSKSYVQEWYGAPVYTPTGLKLGTNMWGEVSAPRNFESTDYPWLGLNRLTYGIRLSEVVLLTADTGIGKTAFCKELEYKLLDDEELRSKGYGIGLLHLEESNADTALGLMSIAADLPLHLPDIRETVDDIRLKKYFDNSVNTDRVIIWDHFGSNSIHEVLSKVRHMYNLGCRYIFLDHLSIIVSDQSGDERKGLDEVSTKLKMLAMELNIAVIAVIHINRRGEVRGSAGPEKIANMIFHLHREVEDPDEWRRNVTKVTVRKNRFCGRTGPACYLWYDAETGRLSELSKADAQRYEEGIRIEEQW